MKKNQSGFSYIDVMIGITILLVGVLAMVAAITRAIATTTNTQEMLVAKQMASSTMEGIFTARELELNGFGWGSIGNVGSSTIPGGLFVTGEQGIYPTPGADGVIGTADDARGPDNIAGNADDGYPVPGYLRTITIVDIPNPIRPNDQSLRRVDVTISYWVGGRRRTETFTSFIANYRTVEDVS